MSKLAVRDVLVRDPVVLGAMRDHCAVHGTSEAAARTLVGKYVDEIVPFFDVLSYYKIGYNLAHLLTRLLYRVGSEYQDREGLNGIPRKDVVLYLMNHRSNADYVVVAYVLARGVSISYAVGEWARIWPLEYIFKSFGAYFVRRSFREPLYHAVLERYVQLITSNGVTQGIFLEGGLTKNGRLQPAKVGLLDYVARTTLDPDFDRDIWLVPVAINYDRVLEDRTLIRELLDEGDRPSKPRQLMTLIHYMSFNILRLLTGRLKRYGRAVVNFGTPLSLRQWSDQNDGTLQLPKAERLPKLQRMADEVMHRLATIMPVTPVPLVCAALLSFEETVVSRSDLLERLDAYRDHLLASGAKLVRAELDPGAILDRGWKMLKLRRLVVREADSYIVLPSQRPLLEYYANSVAHLLPQAPARRPMHPAYERDGSLPRLKA